MTCQEFHWHADTTDITLDKLLLSFLATGMVLKALIQWDQVRQASGYTTLHERGRVWLTL